MLRTVGSKLFSGVRLARGFHTRAALLADDATGAVGLKLRFATPYKIIVGGEHVHMVSIPGEDGEFGVLANHVRSSDTRLFAFGVFLAIPFLIICLRLLFCCNQVPTISPLKPGVVSIHHGNAMDLDVKHYFVSGGFALITPEETSITGECSVLLSHFCCCF